MKRVLISFLFLLIFQTSCGEVTTSNVTDNNENQTPETLSYQDQLDEADSFVFVFATDFGSNGQLYLASVKDNETTLTNLQVQNLGSSAQIQFQNDELFILHDGFSLESSDNLQILDVNNDFATSAQWSVGNGTNPHSAHIYNDTAFVSLYNPSADPENLDEQDHPGDLIELDLASGEILHRYSFYNSLHDDTDRAAHASPLFFDDRLFVGLQDLDSQTFQPNAAGKLAVVDPDAEEVEIVVSLSGRNPVGLTVCDDKIWIAEQATYSFDTFSFDTTPEFGGIEVRDADTYDLIAFFHDEDLGGYVEKIISFDNTVFAVVSDDSQGAFSSKVIRLASDTNQASEAEVFFDTGVDIRAIATHNGYLWISTQETGNTNPKIFVFDIASGEQVGTALEPIATGTSLATE